MGSNILPNAVGQTATSAYGHDEQHQHPPTLAANSRSWQLHDGALTFSNSQATTLNLRLWRAATGLTLNNSSDGATVTCEQFQQTIRRFNRISRSPTNTTFISPRIAA